MWSVDENVPSTGGDKTHLIQKVMKDIYWECYKFNFHINNKINGELEDSCGMNKTRVEAPGIIAVMMITVYVHLEAPFS